jgi:hypothetical protein
MSRSMEIEQERNVTDRAYLFMCTCSDRLGFRNVPLSACGLRPALQNHIDDSVFNLLLFPELFSFDQNMWDCSNIVQAEENELFIK